MGGAVMVGVGRMHSVIERRMLINYRVDPIVARQWVPDGFRVQLVDGVALAGICMIRLARMAPRGVSGVLGWRGENAAHRVAVEWDEGGHTQRGVFITQRFSESPLAVAAGGRLFPGVHTKAAITSHEAPHRITLTMRTPSVAVDADVAIATQLTDSVFPTVSEASDFFRAGATGYSPARRPDTFDGLRLDTTDWRVQPTTPIRVHSTLYDDIIAHTALADLVPQPPPLPWGSLPGFAYLIDETDGVYAAYADGSRIWVSAADAPAALDALLGTMQGYQLGITVATAVAVATRDGIIFFNPALAEPTAEPAHTGYQPALAVTDHIHLLPHPTSEHLVTPEEATAVAATRLHAVIATQATNGHIYPQH